MVKHHLIEEAIIFYWKLLFCEAHYDSPQYVLIGTNQEGKPVYLRDIWPSREELQEIERKHVLPAMFEEVYSKLTEGNERWNGLNAPDTQLYPWDEKSTYIQKPPFFAGMVCVCI